MMHRRVWSAAACVLLALLVIAEVEESVGSWETESFAGDELNDWSWLNVAPYTPPESFEHYPNVRLALPQLPLHLALTAFDTLHCRHAL